MLTLLSLSYLISFGWYSNLSDDVGDNVDWGKNALSLRFDDYESGLEHWETGRQEPGGYNDDVDDDQSDRKQGLGKLDGWRPRPSCMSRTLSAEEGPTCSRRPTK